MPVMPSVTMMTAVDKGNRQENDNHEDHQPHYFIEEFKNLIHTVEFQKEHYSTNIGYDSDENLCLITLHRIILFNLLNQTGGQIELPV
jgi:hypothetical protein